jgi:hypothetical protein
MTDDTKDPCHGLNHHPCQNDIIKRIAAIYPWMIEKDLRIGEIWLHPDQARELLFPPSGQNCTAFDIAWFHSGMWEVNPEDLARERKTWRGGRCIGYLYGAMVIEHELVVRNHICVVPDGMIVQDVSVCSISF